MPPTQLTILPDLPAPPGPVGLIAGGGRLPGLIAEHLRRRGYRVIGVGLSGHHDDDLPPLCHTFRRIPLLRIGAWARALRRQQVRHAILVGRVDKARLMHDPWRVVHNIPDHRTLFAWYRYLRHDRRSHAVLAAIAEELERNGVSLLDSTSPIPDQLATAGVMTRAQPTAEQRADIDFVWPLLGEMLRLDIGQALTVRERDVLAVEAVEGTDRMIQRTGELCRCGGWTLCKGARVGHDRRSDVPTVGPRTLELMKSNGGRCLALAAGDVIMLDREAFLQKADDMGIAVVGVPVARSVFAEDRAAREQPSAARVETLAVLRRQNAHNP